MRTSVWAIALASSFAFVACSKGETKTPPKTPAATKKAPAKAPASKPAAAKAPASQPAAAKAPANAAAGSEAMTIYKTRCATCHGAQGAGDGPAAAALNPKPRSLRTAEWQKSVSDERIAKVIVKGGQSVGLSMLMAANPDLEKKPEVVKDLVKLIRSFGAK